MSAEAGTSYTLGALMVYPSDHAKAYKVRQQATLTKCQSWALTEAQTSAVALCAQQMTNADSSMNGIENKELNDALGSRRVVMTVIKNEKLLP